MTDGTTPKDNQPTQEINAKDLKVLNLTQQDLEQGA